MLFSRTLVRASWIVNVIFLLGTLVWILYDGKFAAAVAEFAKHIAAIGSDQSPFAVVTPLMWPRVDALWLIIVVGSLSTVGIFAGLVAGVGRHRNIRSWLSVTILVAGWLTILTTWPEITWRGQAWRLRGAIGEFEKLSQTLLADWPTSDGRLEGVGQYMAYPIGNPRTLMFVATPVLSDTNLAISTIERGEHDDLHFQLAGNEEGVWLVRHIGVDEPQAFFSGLDGEYIPMKHCRLKSGWFLVRYIYAPTILGDPGASTPLR